AAADKADGVKDSWDAESEDEGPKPQSSTNAEIVNGVKTVLPVGQQKPVSKSTQFSDSESDSHDSSEDEAATATQRAIAQR
ncbi:hypothetical protein, partial [Bilophila wadsworthia]|uniref:hypothetical protein n=1 Tax=Bilophila wadsworthia TaxID=35833 RepID=UPI001EDC428B